MNIDGFAIEIIFYASAIQNCRYDIRFIYPMYDVDLTALRLILLLLGNTYAYL